MPHSMEILIDARSNNSDDVCIPIICNTELFGRARLVRTQCHKPDSE